MTNIYIAGSLFKKQDQVERKDEEMVIQEMGSVDIFNPITAPFNEDKSILPTATTIFKGDYKQVVKADIIVAELDGEDPGVMMELGHAIAINSIRNRLEFALKDSATLIETVKRVLEDYPKKSIFAHTTDIRVESSGRYEGVRVPMSFNQYVVGGIYEYGDIYTNKDAMYATLHQTIKTMEEKKCLKEYGKILKV